MTSLTLTSLVLAALVAQAPEAPAPALVVRHVPVAQVAAGAPLVLRAEVDPAWRLGALVVHHRSTGAAAFARTAFERSADGSFSALVPLPAEQRSPVEYYLSARDTDGTESLRFASAEQPHPVLIQAARGTLEREALLEVYGRRRARVGFFAEGVDYGARTVAGQRHVDRYYRLETDFLYRLFAPAGPLRVDSIRIGVGHLRSDTPPETLSRPFGAPPTQRLGLDYGFSEVELGLAPLLGVAGRLVLGGNAQGFATGVGGRVRIGRPRGARVELEAETVAGLGASGTVRLAWDTVPRFPMSAAAQVTNVPSGPTGVRLLYRADFEASDAVLVGAQLGYQARATVSGGASLGLAASYAW